MNALCASILAVQLLALAAWLASLAAGPRLLGSYKVLSAAIALTAALSLAAPLIRHSPREAASAGASRALTAREAADAGESAEYRAEPASSAAGVARTAGPTAIISRALGAVGFAASWLAAVGAALFAFRLARFSGWARAARRRSELVGIDDGIEYRAWDGPACSFGLARPVVLLPAGGEGDRAAAMRLHETAHVELGHLRWNLLQSMMADVFWFNPAFRAIARRGAEEREFEADEAAVRGMGRRAYAASLVAEAEAGISAACPALASCWKSGLAERVRALGEGRGRLRAAALLPLVAASLLCAAAPAAAAGNEAASAAVPAPAPAAGAATEATATAGAPRSFPSGCRVIDAASAIRVTQPFGESIDPIDGSKYFHNGVDLTVPGVRSPGVIAWDSGRVTRSGFDATYGNFVEIVHDGGFSTLYAKLDSRAVKAGDQVPRGRRIGVLGNTGRSTGPHLHFVVSRDGEAVDPAPYLQR